MFQITVSYPTAEAAIEALARLRGTEVAPGKPVRETATAQPDKAPAPSPRTAKAEAAAASTKTDQPAEKPVTKPAVDEVTAEQITATVLKFVPVPEHKAAALKVISGFKQADGSACARGREIQAADRAAALAQLKAVADELGVDLG